MKIVESMAKGVWVKECGNLGMYLKARTDWGYLRSSVGFGEDGDLKDAQEI